MWVVSVYSFVHWPALKNSLSKFCFTNKRLRKGPFLSGCRFQLTVDCALVGFVRFPTSQLLYHTLFLRIRDIPGLPNILRYRREILTIVPHGFELGSEFLRELSVVDDDQYFIVCGAGGFRVVERSGCRDCAVRYRHFQVHQPAMAVLLERDAGTAQYFERFDVAFASGLLLVGNEPDGDAALPGIADRGYDVRMGEAVDGDIERFAGSVYDADQLLLRFVAGLRERIDHVGAVRSGIHRDDVCFAVAPVRLGP